MKQQDNYGNIFEKYISGHISRSEFEALMVYFSKGNFPEIEDNIKSQLADQQPTVTTDDQLLQSIANVDQVLQARIIKSKRKKIFSLNGLRWAAAAVLFIFLSVALYFLQHTPNNDTGTLFSDISPAQNRGTLIYPDGKKIQYKRDQLSSKHQRISEYSSSIISLQFQTPAGGIYTLVLEDGTKVTLNALTTLKYPSRFSGKKREVELEGEAYFEVAKDAKRPFIVKTGYQSIRVLGTHFNVDAYADNFVQQTSLLEGAVQIEHYKTGERISLSPGDLAEVTSTSPLTVKKIDINSMAVWKDGYLIVQDQSLGTLIRKLERWYNVTFDLGSFSDKTISGIIQTDANLSEVLKGLEINTGLRFERIGRRINTLKIR